MSFNAKLSIEGKGDIRLLHCSYVLKRETDATGRPSSETSGGVVNFTIESTHDISLNEWIVDQFKTKKGSVIFLKRDSNTKMKELKFENAYIVALSESFDSIGDNPMTTHFSITAEILSFGAITYKNEWPKES